MIGVIIEMQQFVNILLIGRLDKNWEEIDMHDTKEFDLEIDRDDVMCSDYDCYRITTINFHKETKTIWSLTYSYIWDCGDGCCSSTDTKTAYPGDINEWVKERVLLVMPFGYKFD